jgi:hypothetical protein
VAGGLSERVLMPDASGGLAWLGAWGRDRTGRWWALVSWTREMSVDEAGGATVHREDTRTEWVDPARIAPELRGPYRRDYSRIPRGQPPAGAVIGRLGDRRLWWAIPPSIRIARIPLVPVTHSPYCSPPRRGTAGRSVPTGERSRRARWRPAMVRAGPLEVAGPGHEIG